MSQPDPALVRALVRWQRAAGPYWHYLCAAPFLATRRGSARGRRPRSRRSPVRELIGPLAQEGGWAVFVDLPIVPSILAAPELNQRGFAVVPIIARWIDEPAVLETGRLLDVLEATAHQLRRPRAETGVVFLLDGERAGPSTAAPAAGSLWRRFDNRYAFATGHLPLPELLLACGIRQLGWLDGGVLAPDLLECWSRLDAAGLAPRRLEPGRASAG